MDEPRWMEILGTVLFVLVVLGIAWMAGAVLAKYATGLWSL
jgi:hypothetical protein